MHSPYKTILFASAVVIALYNNATYDPTKERNIPEILLNMFLDYITIMTGLYLMVCVVLIAPTFSAVFGLFTKFYRDIGTIGQNIGYAIGYPVEAVVDGMIVVPMFRIYEKFVELMNCII